MLRGLNDLSLTKKFAILLLCCVLIPVISLEAVVAIMYSSREKRREEVARYEIVTRVKENFEHTIDYLITFSDYIYTDELTNNFLCNYYLNEVQYYKEFLNFTEQSALEYGQSMNSLNGLKKIVIYTDNPTIIGGSYIQSINNISSEDWYQKYCESRQEQLIYCNDKTREISILTRLDYYLKRNEFDTPQDNGVLKVDLDMDMIDWSIEKQNYQQNVFVCYDDKIIFTNAGSEYLLTPIQSILSKRKRITQDELFEDGKWKVYGITVGEYYWYRIFVRNKFLLPLLILTIFLPTFLMFFINRSIIRRIELLENHFSFSSDSPMNPNQVLESSPKCKPNQLVKKHMKQVNCEDQYELMCPLDGYYGKDEIGRLIDHYNSYIQYLRKLSQAERKQREEKNALDIAIKQAEINALNSQVNPHFLYNSIESICMRSVLKKEHETASIMRDLSLLLREVSSWEDEVKTLNDELIFIEHYLHIQKYRFGDKIQWKITIDDKCKQLIIPKLCILSFVENACVHGIENSLTNGQIEIIANYKDDSYCIQIKDNGVGMTSEEQDVILQRLQNVSIESFKSSKSTGIMAAYLRLQMLFGNDFKFSLDSRKDEGTLIELQIKMNEVTLC